MLLYVNVDAEGNIIDALYGKNIIPDRGSDFFFFTDETTAENAFKYKVVLNGFKASLEIQEGEIIPGLPPREPSELEILQAQTEMNALAFMEYVEMISKGGI